MCRNRRLYNIKTFTETPIRMRIDRAISILERDVIISLNHFQKKYRVNFALDDVMEKLLKDLSQFATSSGSIKQQILLKNECRGLCILEKESK